jgi:FkbM family methyltransferase
MALNHQLGWEEVSLVNEFLLKNKEKENLVVFDIGTNRGLFVDLFINDFNKCSIDCFEPLQWLYNNLLIKYYQYNNIVFNNIGVSNYNGISLFNELTDLTTDGCSSIIERPVFKERGWNYNQYEIPVTTIDTYSDEKNIDFIDFIKIDVEGCETLVFEGMLNRLKSKKVGLIQFEYGTTFLDGGFSLKSILDLSIECKYTLCYHHFGMLVDINYLNLEEISKIGNINLIFKPND